MRLSPGIPISLPPSNPLNSMKPFDLSLAKAGRPIADRSGNPVIFIAHVPEAVPNSRVVVLDVRGLISTHYEDGRVATSCDKQDDLCMMVPTIKRAGWGWMTPSCKQSAQDMSKATAQRLAIQFGGTACRIEWDEEVPA